MGIWLYNIISIMKITNLYQVKRILENEEENLSKEYGVSKIGVFGSFVFGDYRDDSDIDLLVEFNKPIGLFDFIGLENYLTDKLGRKVDLVAKKGLKRYIRKNILNSVVYA